MNLYLVVLALVAFLLGILIGHGINTGAQIKRGKELAMQKRRLTDQQQELQAQYRALRLRKEADEESMRWECKRQCGMAVVVYDPNKPTD